MCEITADAPVFDVRHQHQSDTNSNYEFNLFLYDKQCGTYGSIVLYFQNWLHN